MKELGIAVPLFSIHSEGSCGRGEFPDLKLLVDLCKSIGFSILHILPLNDTGKDHSPYSSVSAFALNPLYLRLDEKLSHCPTDYQELRKLKLDILRSKKLTYPPEFLEEHPWLHAYAKFKGGDPEFHIAVQYLCFQQLLEAKAYAQAHEVKIMGDLPILVSGNSADVQAHPQFFDHTYHAGAPPDKFCKEGQNWHLPLYDWEALAKEDYSWWRERIETLSLYCDLYRIDHIVGLFRIWAIPKGALATQGHFIPEARREWQPQGQRLLRMILGSSKAQVIGEDLGVIPPECTATMAELKIPGTKLIRWDDEFPQNSCTTVATHDMPNIRLWWELYPKEVDFVCNLYKIPRKLEEALPLILKASHETQSRYTINPIQDYLALNPNFRPKDPREERINTPGTVGPHNWSYRTQPSLETLIQSQNVQNLLA